jgi:hypothetical protein
MDNSNCLQESFDIDKVDDNGWLLLEDLFDLFGVDVNGIWFWNESILGSNDDASIFIILSCLNFSNDVIISNREEIFIKKEREEKKQCWNCIRAH